MHVNYKVNGNYTSIPYPVMIHFHMQRLRSLVLWLLRYASSKKKNMKKNMDKN